MKFNYSYVLDFPSRYLFNQSDLTILDFGCGSGEVVKEGISRGFSIYGVDVHLPDPLIQSSLAADHSETVFREITQEKIPFPDDFFDYVISNQVFEHVAELEKALMEISRVLKPNGLMLGTFPTRDIWREVHCGIPFIHWFNQNSNIRYPYLILLKSMGFGKYKNDHDSRSWAKETLNWLDKNCFYRDRRTIYRMLSQYFDVSRIEDDYLQQRLLSMGKTSFAKIIKIPILNLAAIETMRKFGGLVLLGKNKKRFSSESGIAKRIN